MSMGNSGLFETTAGARALKTDAPDGMPVGFDETPPESVVPDTAGAEWECGLVRNGTAKSG